MKIRVQLRPDPTCTRHGKRYPRGSSCPDCRRGTVPGQRPIKPRTPTRKHAKVEPYTCSCGRYVQNTQGICPGPDC